MEEDKITLAVTEANTTLSQIIQKAVLFAFKKGVVKELVRMLCFETETKLETLGADQDLIDKTIQGIKETFMRQYAMILLQLEDFQKELKLGAVANTIMNMKSTEKVVLSEKGMILTQLDDFVKGKSKGETDLILGIANAHVENIRDYMTEYELGGTGRQVEYTDRLEAKMVIISQEIADGRLTITDSKGRNKSLRNMAEISTRYELISNDLKRATEKSKFSYNGYKLVCASAHADCSERCSYWQGKIFINDIEGAREMGEFKGKPKQDIVGYIDNKPIYSLKQACENGFLSYNCQHHLVAYYTGVNPPHYDMVSVKRKRNLTTKQRYLENVIRKYKAREEVAVPVIVNKKNPFTKETEEMSLADFYKKKVDFYEKQYKDFCKEKKLPEYRWRTQISDTERKL